ncbi:kinase domain-containing [Cryptosporidium sp. chipmunk genotype I]|uniref:kinase domain-containing n=1 Tax=Cryptosporidium sp. chipmunk genotype I TaxID=1280935 RepID=UPI00351A1852|nr:kinase domain-containing [Cryptosporidium sp. chipmunk genotype I]
MNNNSKRAVKLNLLDNIENLKQSVLLNKATIEANYLERCERVAKNCITKNNQKDENEDDIRLLRKRVSIKDFKILSPIGAGAFGVIRLAECRNTGSIYALKQMRKSIIRTKNQLERIYNERALLVKNASDFVVKLFYTFQDEKHLYQVMEYLPGGDLMSYLIKYDKFSEEDTKFYMAQLVHAVDLVHQLGFVHRDVKPDNIVLDSEGHLKLLDFGLCKFSPLIEGNENGEYETTGSNLRCIDLNIKSNKDSNKPSETFLNEKNNENKSTNREFFQGSNLLEEKKNYQNKDLNIPLKHLDRNTIHSTVGTPQYMAPEIFLRQGYTHLVDWWSVGILMYECLYGGVPFNDDTHNPIKVAIKVMQWEKLLLLPHPCRKISPEALDLLKNLLCHPSKRFDGEQIKKHPFFNEVDWDKLRQCPAPFNGQINETIFKSNIMGVDLIDESPNSTRYGVQGSSLVDINFLDYTYRNKDRNYDPVTIGETIKMCG